MRAAQLLLAAGAQRDPVNSSSETPLLLAAQCDAYCALKAGAPLPRTLSSIIADSPCPKGRLLHYFAAEAGGQAASSSWCGIHRDHGSLTGLCSAMFLDADGSEVANPDPDHAGLWIRDREGGWVGGW